MAGIEIRGLARQFRDGTRALDGVDLDVAAGELLVLVGPSGSGKTTLLKQVAGLDQPTAGSVRLGGKDLAGVPPHKRNVALVFQNLALYSHLTVADNLAFGLNHERRQRGSGSAERGADISVGDAAKLLGIGHLLDRYPAELSGGEQQRVALGRAIVRQPAALLLDEPLSSLDAPVRRVLRREVKQLQRQLDVPTIYVTHDQAEALALGDRIAVLDRGRLQQVGPPDEIYNRPANRFVAEFFGPQGMNLIEGQLMREGESASFKAITLTIELPPDTRLPKSGHVLCGFRPEDATYERGGSPRGKITSIESLGSTTLHRRNAATRYP
jgi:multiple sugar transport system ATP-binding protein